MHIVQVQIDTGLVQVGNAGIAHRRQNAAQVWVAGVEGCLHQGRVGDGIGHLAALFTSLAAFHAHGDELGCPLAVAHDGLGQLLRHIQHGSQQGLPFGAVQRGYGCVGCLVGRHHHERIVGRGVAIDRHAVERPVCQMACQLLHYRCIHTGIGGQKAQHGRHVGADHACALADACDGHGGTTDLGLGAERLGQGVRGHDAFGGARPVVRLRIGQRGGQTGLDAVGGQGLHDHASGKRQHLLGRHVQQARQGLAGRARTRQAIGPRAGVGVASVDDHGAHAFACGQMLAAHLHRRCAKAVLREDASHAGPFVQQKHREVLAIGLADARFGHANTNTCDGMQVSRHRGQKIYRHRVLFQENCERLCAKTRVQMKTRAAARVGI